MKLFRKLAALSLTAALSAGMVPPASAVSAPAVQVDGGTVDTSAYINADSRTMVPVTIAEALGLDCTADGDSAAFSLCGRSQTYSAGTAAGDTFRVPSELGRGRPHRIAGPPSLSCPLGRHRKPRLLCCW